MNDVLAGNFAPDGWRLWPPQSVRVINWNIDRGLRLREITEFLVSQQADVLVLQEVDLNARRTHRLNIAEELARKLRMNYVFGLEFQELTQGSRTSPAYHGQATLSRWRLANPRIIRFRCQSEFWRPRWFLPRMEPFQERLGGRIALITEINTLAMTLMVYNLHLESRGSDSIRLFQLTEVLQNCRRCVPPRLPTLIAGDLNSDASRAVPGSVIRDAGFRNALGLTAPHTTPARGILQAGRSID